MVLFSVPLSNRVEFQGRVSIHVHVALWAMARLGMELKGRTGEHYLGDFVNYLASFIGGCKVDVQLGSGQLNYIDGYVDKATYAIDSRPKGHFQDKDSNAPWRQTYRLLCKKALLLTEGYGYEEMAEDGTIFLDGHLVSGDPRPSRY